MSKFYIVGGWTRLTRRTKSRDINLSSCYTYDINSEVWNIIAELNVARNRTSCTVFEGKVVVTGGYNHNGGLKSVEAYDYYENRWTYLPDMTKKRRNHSTASMCNKMFVVGGKSTINCEVFDSYSRKFSEIKSGIIVPDMNSFI